MKTINSNWKVFCLNVSHDNIQKNVIAALRQCNNR